MKDDLPLALIAVFVPFSLVSIGGGISVMAGIQHEVVDVRHWVTPRDFVDLFAISRAAPGPGSMLSTLIGWHMMGWTGAIITTLSLFVPSSRLAAGRRRLDPAHRRRRRFIVGRRLRIGGPDDLAAKAASPPCLRARRRHFCRRAHHRRGTRLAVDATL